MFFQIPGCALLPQSGPPWFPFPSRMTGSKNDSEKICSSMKNIPFLSSYSSPSASHCVVTQFPLLRERRWCRRKIGGGQMVPKLSSGNKEGWPVLQVSGAMVHPWVPQGRYTWGRILFSARNTYVKWLYRTGLTSLFILFGHWRKEVVFGQQRWKKESEEERGWEESGEEAAAHWQSSSFYFLVPGAGWQRLSLTDSGQEARMRAKGKGKVGLFPSQLWLSLPLFPPLSWQEKSHVAPWASLCFPWAAQDGCRWLLFLLVLDFSCLVTECGFGQILGWLFFFFMSSYF